MDAKLWRDVGQKGGKSLRFRQNSAVFGRQNRLSAEKDIKRVLKVGKRLSAKEYSFYVLPNNQKAPRVAIVVSASVHKSAVRRNIIKRQLRDILRLAIKENRVEDIDLVIMIRPLFLQVPKERWRQIFLAFCVRYGIIKI